MLKSVRFFAITAVALPTLAQANLVQNGSFELGSVRADELWVSVAAGSNAITGWTSTGNGVDVVGTFWTASDGNMSIDINSYFAGGGIEQSIATVVGQQYQLTFDMAGNMHLGPDEKIMQVSIGDQSNDFTFDYVAAGATPLDPKWSQMVMNFTATDTMTTLSFEGVSEGTAGAALDNVSVNVVPAPGVLSGLGLCGLIATRRRRH